MKSKGKKCWPWSHTWTKWALADGTVINNISGKVCNTAVQLRHCETCGFHQIEGLKGR